MLVRLRLARPLVLNGVEEKGVKGGRHLFPKLKQAFAGVHR